MLCKQKIAQGTHQKKQIDGHQQKFKPYVGIPVFILQYLEIQEFKKNIFFEAF